MSVNCVLFEPLDDTDKLDRDLRRNRLSGKVPNTLSDLQSLNYMYVHWCRFIIVITLFHNLIIYDVSSPIDCSNLADNNLYGDIPVQLLQVAQHEYGRY